MKVMLGAGDGETAAELPHAEAVRRPTRTSRVRLGSSLDPVTLP
jgi:hypothetical protein